MTLLPKVETDDDVDRLRAEDRETCCRAIAAVAAQEGLGDGEAEFFEEGSALVGGFGRRVIKIFAGFDRALRDTEVAVLSSLEGRLSCRTPSVESSGEFEGWPYLVMSRLNGVALSDVWGELDLEEKERLCVAIGESAAELHRVPVGSLADLEPRWDLFLQSQRRAASEKQRGHSLAEEWVEQIDPFLLNTALPERSDVILHTELMRQHFLVERGASGWSLTGLVDFEPAMIGQPEYDFASVGLFVTSGEQGLLGPLLRSYGYTTQQLDEEFQRRALCYTILHRYSCLPWYFRFMPMEGATTLDQIAKRWWCY